MAHIHDKIDFTAAAYIIYEDKVLLRYHEKYHRWLGPGGHVELDQDPVETVHKEVMEEVGLEVEIISDAVKNFPRQENDFSEDYDIPTPLFINRHRISDSHEHIGLIYAARAKTMDIKPGEGEHADPNSFKWVTAEELQNLADVSPRAKFHALTALRKAREHRMVELYQ